MASTVTVRVAYGDGSKSLSEEFGVADTHPSPVILKSLEKEMLDKWEAMGNSWRGIKTTITVKQS